MATRTKVRLSDLAALANVSVPTVSMALANHPGISAQTRRKVWALSRRMGYRQRAVVTHADQMPSATVKRLGCVCLGGSFERPNIAMRMACITAYASRMKVALDAACIEDLSDDKKVVESLMRFAEPLDGLLMEGIVGPTVMTAVAKAHIPCVALGDQPAEQRLLPLDVVTFDHVFAGRIATGHLLRRGHRRIGFISDTLKPGGANLRWLDGYRLAHLDASVTLDDQLVGVSNVIDSGAAALARKLTSLASPPTAWVVVNNHQAAELLITLKEMGRPDDVCGLYTDPPPDVKGLSAIRYSVQTFCDVAMARLMQLCKSPGQPTTRILVPFETHKIDFP